MESTRWSRLAVLFASTIFLSAFLLFQVQPLISRFILPWFGGSPAVWTTCLLFFQTVLFAGYAYAHVSEHYLGPKVRTIVHLTLIGAALLTLPITPSDGWKPVDSDYPTARILALLAVCVGLPYFVLASTGPLVQAWFSRAFPGRSPYRLYSLSNFGSLLALLSYPFVVEPALDGHAQSLWWTAGFVLFCFLCGTACWLTEKLHSAAADAAADTTAGRDSQLPASNEPPPTWKRRLLWLALPALASILLMATTNHVCQDMPPVPFLWVVPLSLYLVSFIIAFDHERWYRRLPYGVAALIAVYLTAGMYNPAVWGAGWLGDVHSWLWGAPATPWWPRLGYVFDIFCQFSGLFLLCMLCHGELVRLRPPPRYLTSFYLMISAGGALGGLSVSLVAPQVFNTFAEWKIGLACGFVLAATVAFVLAGSTGAGFAGWSSPQRLWLSLRGALRTGGILAALLALIEIVQLLRNDDPSNNRSLEKSRNFYGVLTVNDVVAGKPPIYWRELYNGRIVHGLQFIAPGSHEIATCYYSNNSAVGQALKYFQRESARSGDPFRVGVIGLGVGTLATYVYLPGHSIRFYEINPDVMRVAETYFTYLADARKRGASVEVVLGDGRLSLERELKEAPRNFDLLVLDAFSSDSIPIHLLTLEAFEIYLPHLAPEGAVAVHISNRHLDLAPVVFGLAEHFGLDAVRVFTDDAEHGGWMAEWIVLSRNQELLKMLSTIDENSKSNAPKPPLPVWTDQRHNLLEVLK
jgi:MFS family permease